MSGIKWKWPFGKEKRKLDFATKEALGEALCVEDLSHAMKAIKFNPGVASARADDPALNESLGVSEQEPIKKEKTYDSIAKELESI